MMDGHAVLDRIEVAAELDDDDLAEVTFAVREGDGDYVPIGTDDNAPYRVFFDAGDLRGQEDTTLSFRAIVNDLSGHLAADEVVNVGVEFAGAERSGDAVRADPLPAPGRRLRRPHHREQQRLLGTAPVGERDRSRRRRPTGRARSRSSVRTSTAGSRSSGWPTTRKRSTSSCTRATRRTRTTAPTAASSRRPRRRSGSGRAIVTIYTSQAEAQGSATVHYECADCTDARCHQRWRAGGDGLAARRPRTTTGPCGSSRQPTSQADHGHDQRRGRRRHRPAEFTPTETPTAWFQAGEQVVHPSTRRRGGLRHDPLPAAGRRLRRRHEHRFQRLLGSARLGRRGPAAAVDGSAPTRR